jgi:hypothetical protein
MSGPGGIRFNLNKVRDEGKGLSNASGASDTPPLMRKATKVTEEARQRMPASAKKVSVIHPKCKPKVGPPKRPPPRPTVPAPTQAPRQAKSARRDAPVESPRRNEEARNSLLGALPVRPTMPPGPARPTVPPPTLPPRRPETSKKAERSEMEQPPRSDVIYSDLPPISPRIEGDRNVVTPKLTDPGTN